MKNPNGYGSVYKLGGNRRKPYAVRVTLSCPKDQDGKRKYKYKYLGYYETKEAAMIALAEYNKNPYDIDAARITFSEVYEKWSEVKFQQISISRIRQYKAAYKAIPGLHDQVFAELRLAGLQKAVDVSGKNIGTLQQIKDLIRQLYKYALKNDICTKDYSSFIDLSLHKDKTNSSDGHRAFTAEEVDQFWSLSEEPAAKTVLILIYTGCRISELLDLKKQDVHLDDCYFEITHSKTSAGLRKVPIANKIKPFMEYFISSGSDYLISFGGLNHFKHAQYMRHWRSVMHMANISDNPTPHSTRYTTTTLLATAKVDDWIIRKIIGHAGISITESVYTDFDIRILIDAINKI